MPKTIKKKTTRKKTNRKKPQEKPLVAPAGQEEKIDWEEAEKTFVTSEKLIPLAKLARDLGVHPVTMYVKAAKRGWREKRHDFWKDIIGTVEAEVRDIAIASRVRRFRKTCKLVDKILDNMTTRDPSLMEVNDLIKLIELEKSFITHVPEASQPEIEGILEAQIVSIRASLGKREGNFRQVVDAGLHRLGLLPESSQPEIIDVQKA